MLDIMITFLTFLSYVKPILFVLIVILIYNIYSRRRIVVCLNEIPCTKLKFWQILGHARMTKDRILRRTSTGLSYDIYEFQWAVSYMTLFRDVGMCSLWYANKPFVTVFRADTVKAILNHSTELRKAWFYRLFHTWIGTGLLTSESEKWKQRRKMLTPTFHFNILKDFIPGINRHSQILVDILQTETHKPWINIVPFLSRCSLDIICETTLGMKACSQTDAESDYVKAVLELSEAVAARAHVPWYWPDKLFRLTAFGKRCLRDIETVHNFTKKVIAKRKAEIQEKMSKNENNDHKSANDGEKNFRYKNRKALMEFLMEEHLNFKSISEDGIREEIDTFTFEGHDTTSMGMSWAIYLIGLYPEVQEKLQKELNVIFGEDKERPVNVEDLANMKYLECILKESLRLYPSVPLFARELIEDLEIQGYTIPKGTTCAINTYVLHRDPKVFPNPEEFDPDRFLPENSEGRDSFAYVPFSAGPRNCIGQRFAMIEEKIVLATMIRNFHVKSLDHRDKVHAVNNMVLRPDGGIRVKLEKRET